MIKPMNETWGFYGTSKGNYELPEEKLASIYDKVAKLLVQELAISERKAQCFLDSRFGRHFSDALSFEGINKKSAERTFVIAAKKLVRKGGWTKLIVNQEIF